MVLRKCIPLVSMVVSCCALKPIPTIPGIARPIKGFNILEIIPGGQGPLVAAVREVWRLEWLVLMTELAPQSKSGGYVRTGYSVREEMPSDQFPIDLNRYHAYIGNPCPWCHRVGIAKALYGLTDEQLSVTNLLDDPTKASRGGWILDVENSPDPVFGARDLKGVYDALMPGYQGRCTAPLLVDKKTKKIVSNDSVYIMYVLAVLASSHTRSKIQDSRAAAVSNIEVNHPPVASVRLPLKARLAANKVSGSDRRAMVASASRNSNNDIDSSRFSSCDRGNDEDGHCEDEEMKLEEEVEEMKTWLFENVNNAVYRSGFATQQGEHDRASREVSAALLNLEDRLSKSKFLHGEVVTESDIFLLPTIERFDSVYSTIFKCTRVRVAECPNIRRWHKEMRSFPGIRDTYDPIDALRSYFEQMFPLNPSRIVPGLPHWQEALLLEEKSVK